MKPGSIFVPRPLLIRVRIPAVPDEKRCFLTPAKGPNARVQVSNCSHRNYWTSYTCYLVIMEFGSLVFCTNFKICSFVLKSSIFLDFVLLIVTVKFLVDKICFCFLFLCSGQVLFRLYIFLYFHFFAFQSVDICFLLDRSSSTFHRYSWVVIKLFPRNKFFSC